MARPVYLVYEVSSMCGTTFDDEDVPDILTFVGACEAVNSDHARSQYPEIQGPAVVLRLNTLKQGALKR